MKRFFMVALMVLAFAAKVWAEGDSAEVPVPEIPASFGPFILASLVGLAFGIRNWFNRK